MRRTKAQVVICSSCPLRNALRAPSPFFFSLAVSDGFHPTVHGLVSSTIAIYVLSLSGSRRWCFLVIFLFALFAISESYEKKEKKKRTVMVAEPPCTGFYLFICLFWWLSYLFILLQFVFVMHNGLNDELCNAKLKGRMKESANHYWIVVLPLVRSFLLFVAFTFSFLKGFFW